MPRIFQTVGQARPSSALVLKITLNFQRVDVFSDFLAPAHDQVIADEMLHVADGLLGLGTDSVRTEIGLQVIASSTGASR